MKKHVSSVKNYRGFIGIGITINIPEKTLHSLYKSGKEIELS